MDEEPQQMTREQMLEMLESGEDPVKICIEKYTMFKAWVQYRIDNSQIGDLWDKADTGGFYCALCYVYFDDDNDSCRECPLDQAGHGCNKSMKSVWRIINNNLNFMDSYHCRAPEDPEFIAAKTELLYSIDDMINALNEILKSSDYVYIPASNEVEYEAA